MTTYHIEVYNNSKVSGHLETHSFEAENDQQAIEELESYLSPQDDGKTGKYELSLFAGEGDSDQRFIKSIKLNAYA